MLFAVDGDWTEWSRWLDCSVTCGQGTQRRYRDCYGATQGSSACLGEAEETQTCDEGPCPGSLQTFVEIILISTTP